MRKCAIACVAVLAAALPGVASAQQPTAPTREDVATLVEDVQINHRAMYEDIEILSRILDRALGLPRYSTPGSQWLTPQPVNPNVPNAVYDSAWIPPNAPNLANPYLGVFGSSMQQQSCLQFPGAEGVYLPGYGAVFTLTLPQSEATAKTTLTVHLRKPTSEWDRVRRQIRGETPKPDDKKQAPRKPSVAEVVIKVLADNGRHFSLLAANEKLTVVVTFQPPADGSGARSQPNPTTTDKGQAPANPHGPVETLGSPVVQNLLNEGNYELLGKLQLEQGKGKEAIQALKKAADSASDPRHAAELYLKIAGLYLSAEHDTKLADRMTRKAMELLQRAGSTPAPVAPAAAPKPIKLIITATKQQLADIGAGRLTLDAFEKAITIQTVTR